MTLLEFRSGLCQWHVLAVNCILSLLREASVPAGWRVSITVAGLVTGIAFIHYMYMRDVWIMTGESPTVYRYIDWLITVPLLMLEFYFVLAAVGKANSGVFWRLLIGSVVMLVGGYLGEAGYINATLGFVIGMAGWFYILYEVFSGEAGKNGSKKWKQSSCYCIWCYENDRYSWLGYLSIRLRIWLPNRWYGR